MLCLRSFRLMAAQAQEDTTTPIEDFAIAIAAVAALFAAGRYLLNPSSGDRAHRARDVMIARRASPCHGRGDDDAARRSFHGDGRVP